MSSGDGGGGQSGLNENEHNFVPTSKSWNTYRYGVYCVGWVWHQSIGACILIRRCMRSSPLVKRTRLSQASASWCRIKEVLDLPLTRYSGLGSFHGREDQ